MVAQWSTKGYLCILHFRLARLARAVFLTLVPSCLLFILRVIFQPQLASEIEIGNDYKIKRIPSKQFNGCSHTGVREMASFQPNSIIASCNIAEVPEDQFNVGGFHGILSHLSHVRHHSKRQGSPFSSHILVLFCCIPRREMLKGEKRENVIEDILAACYAHGGMSHEHIHFKWVALHIPTCSRWAPCGLQFTARTQSKISLIAIPYLRSVFESVIGLSHCLHCAHWSSLFTAARLGTVNIILLPSALSKTFKEVTCSGQQTLMKAYSLLVLGDVLALFRLQKEVACWHVLFLAPRRVPVQCMLPLTSWVHCNDLLQWSSPLLAAPMAHHAFEAAFSVFFHRHQLSETSIFDQLLWQRGSDRRTLHSKWRTALLCLVDDASRHPIGGQDLSHMMQKHQWYVSI